jgi:hypothetical protein
LLALTSTSDSNVCKAVKYLRPSKSVGLDDVTSFVINVIQKFCAYLYIYFQFYLSQQKFPTLWKQAAIVPIFKKVSEPLLTTADLYMFLTTF